MLLSTLKSRFLRCIGINNFEDPRTRPRHHPVPISEATISSSASCNGLHSLPSKAYKESSTASMPKPLASDLPSSEYGAISSPYPSSDSASSGDCAIAVEKSSAAFTAAWEENQRWQERRRIASWKKYELSSSYGGQGRANGTVLGSNHGRRRDYGKYEGGSSGAGGSSGEGGGCGGGSGGGDGGGT